MQDNLQQEVQTTLKFLREGKIILYPTDTVWGIGCDATNADAVKRIFDLKKRSDAKSLIVLVSDDRMLNKHINEVPEAAWDLLDVADQPMTIIYPDARNMAKNVGAEDGTVAIRMIKDSFCNPLIHKLGKPLISTSANISGQPTPKSFADIDPAILSGVDYVVNLRQNERSNPKPSSILKVDLNGEIKIIRQ